MLKLICSLPGGFFDPAIVVVYLLYFGEIIFLIRGVSSSYFFFLFYNFQFSFFRIPQDPVYRVIVKFKAFSKLTACYNFFLASVTQLFCAVT